ncbi:FG-GAP-like repeat-containing protein [Flavivirga algicola]|uniref:T9SS type A sorting domain-containing protein n=1 Tax=Flavivirga algicola TaxID=2729136 RepID=A0ABX1S0H4_9FLAO|nr:FG-GAP-like repeat-containing protein [Flavivirga algicola]NMH88383.1 T9SS type A sorting domain-containing protein [Flavivirga algicola]
MKISLILKFVLGLIVTNQVVAQTFHRSEVNAGLGILSENNGVAVADYDGDHDLDLFVVAKAKDNNSKEISKSRLFRNKGNGQFEDVTEISGLVNLFPFSETADLFSGLDGIKYGASWGDYDNDGFPDIFFTHSFKIQLFHNQGDGTFVERTVEAGFEKYNACRNTSATWFDVNNDGFLDIYISDWGACTNNSFYINNGDGTFENVTDQFGDDNTKLSYMSVPFDFNDDGWMDLYVANDKNDPNELFINSIGTSFEERASDYRVNNFGDDMGISVNDYNNDGLFDFFVTNIGENILLTNQGNSTFIDVAIGENISSTGWAWDVNFADFDLDGDEDLFVVNGFSATEYNAYFKNLLVEGGTGFSDITEQVNLKDLTKSVGSTPFDYDNDGDLDLFITNTDRESFFYENDIINGEPSASSHWFKVVLQGTTSNRNAIGTRLTITTNQGTLHRYYTGLGFLSQSLLPVHFGLGEATSILELRIQWPSGLIETHENLNVDTYILAEEGNGYTVLDLPDVNKTRGCTDPNSCNYNPEAVINDGSCTYLESKVISGKSNVNSLSVEMYSYPDTIDSELNWSVTGGEIIEEQANSITVKWGIGPLGEVSVIESNSECSSQTIGLNVGFSLSQNHSIARIWNEALLQAIRNDYARPTVHARNLFHASVAMYDSWAIYNQKAKPYLIGNQVHGFNSVFDGFETGENIEENRNKTISYAMYRLLNHRFKNSPNKEETYEIFDSIMNNLGFDVNDASIDYSNGSPSALGNFIAQTIIDYGLVDGSRETRRYDNSFYLPINAPLAPIVPGNNNITDPNRWQPLSLEQFIDQSGNLVNATTPDFLSPEWGTVNPFSLQEGDKKIFSRDGDDYSIYHNPDAPPQLNEVSNDASSNAYKWGFSLVSIWGAHLDPLDNVIWDISPKSIGNIDVNSFPSNYVEYPNFYDEIEGGDISIGHSVNPHTGAPYQEQLVPRGDYARVLAEFWADGPDSETPPGHWFTLLNYVSDHSLFTKKLNGKGDILDALEWDVKSYFIMGGTMHDAAIAAWGIKGWYDYVRPISAIRYMAELGQSSDSEQDNYNVAGIPLKEGYIEVVEENDPLVGNNSEHLGKIKLYTWRGHDYIGNPESDNAGVGWILAENWWPYQRPSFITPPFAGFVSGHSTYSRAAAEVMTLLTGDAFFPGGYGEFIARKNEFLVFEEGPSVDVKLQWATYRDASDQCSLSRIWGGIHPPADDIPGRLIGEQIGVDAYEFGVRYFEGKTNGKEEGADYIMYPNPTNKNTLYVANTKVSDVFQVFDLKGSSISIESIYHDDNTKNTRLTFSNVLVNGVYLLRINNDAKLFVKR